MDLNNFLAPVSEIFKSGAFDFLEEIDEETLSPIALLLNVDEKRLTALLKLIPPFFKGDIGLKEVLPFIIPLFLSFLSKNSETTEKIKEVKNENSQKPTYSPTFEQNNTANENLFPFADNDIEYSLNAYFNSFNAS